MSQKTKIIIAIIGGAVVGGLGVCSTVWPDNALVFAASSSAVAIAVATFTGISTNKSA